MTRSFPRALLAALCCASAAAGCGGGSGAESGARATVVATTTQLGDFARTVGGARVDVKQIVPPNADPHAYEPRPSDALALGDAAVVLRSGGDVDEWLADLVESADAEGRIVSLIDFVGAADADGEADPHWWQNPRDAVSAVHAIRDALVKADPGGREVYTRNTAAYVRRLRRLDREVAACVRQIPRSQRRLVTTHDALGPYAERYGFEVIGALIPSLSTQAQPSAKDTNALVDQIERLDVRAIFPESSVNQRLETAVARETGAKVGKALWADTLGPKGSSGATYVESIEANTEAIVEGLGGGSATCDL